MKRNIEVRCSNGKIYKTIRAAAKAAGVNEWTFGQKLGVCGNFIDREGNEYIRTRPANFKDKYKNTGNRLLRPHSKPRVVVKEESQELPLGNPNLVPDFIIKAPTVTVNDPLDFDISGGSDNFTMTIKNMSAQRLAKVIVLLTKGE